MYATLAETEAITYARQAFSEQMQSGEKGRLPKLEEQVCAESGIWDTDVAAMALRQAGGDTANAVSLIRVWVASLDKLPPIEVSDETTMVSRRISSAFHTLPQGQWLGAAPDFANRILDFEADKKDPEPASHELFESRATDTTAASDPVKSKITSVRCLLGSAPVKQPTQYYDHITAVDDAAAKPDNPDTLTERHAVLAQLALGESACLISAASKVLAYRREAVLAELMQLHAKVYFPHPATRTPCVIGRVDYVSAEAIVDADVDGRPGFAIGSGVTFGTAERRAIALALIDGALQTDDSLSATEILASVNVTANNGFVEHLRLPHYASFSSYLGQATAQQEEAKP